MKKSGGPPDLRSRLPRFDTRAGDPVNAVRAQTTLLPLNSRTTVAAEPGQHAAADARRAA
jgi:hypothetical protein